MSYTRKQLENWLKTINVKTDCLLDIGNSQLKINNRVKSFDVKEYVGLDLKQPHEGEKQDIICDMNLPIEFI